MKFDSAHRLGMRRAAPLALAALLASAAGCRPSDSADSPAPPSAPPAAPDGAAVYAMACARCHGPDGAGDGELAARLGVPTLRTPRVAAMPAAEMAALVRDGRGAMPPHGNRLPAAEIDAVVQHVRALGAAR
ncbi:MAG: cytochrome c [bacterium]